MSSNERLSPTAGDLDATDDGKALTELALVELSWIDDEIGDEIPDQPPPLESFARLLF